MNTKFIIITILIIISLLGGIGYFIFSNQTIPEKFEQQPGADQKTNKSQKTEEIGATNGSDAQTKNWKMYKNTRYGYQFKYPETEWQFGQFPALEKPPSEIANEVTLTRIVTVKPNEFSSYSFYHMRFIVSVHPNPDNLTLKEWYYFPQWVGEKYKNAPFEIIGFPVNKLEEKDLEDLKMKARTVSYPSETKEAVFRNFPALKTAIDVAGSITVAKNNFMYSIGWHIADNEDPQNPASQLFEKILATFSFVN